MNQIPLNTSLASGVAIASYESEAKILLLRRSNEGFWCHVAGKIEQAEKAWEAIIREFKEETGIVVTELYSAEYLEQFYEPSRNCITIIPVFVVKLAAEPKIKLNDEHTEYRWCSLAEAKSLVPFPNQRAVYNHIWSNFIEKPPSWRMKVKMD